MSKKDKKEEIKTEIKGKYVGARFTSENYDFEMRGVGKLEKGKVYPQISEAMAIASIIFEPVYKEGGN